MATPPAAQTAVGPMVIVAVEQHYAPGRRLIDDDLAVRFLPRGMRVAVRACRWRALRSWTINATEKRAPGIWGSVTCRKRYIADKVSAAVREGIPTVVNLGAGHDTLVYRLPPHVRAYELDLPANIAAKRQRVSAVYGRTPAHVSLVGLDFQTGALGAALAAHGFRTDEPAIFVWEAVTQYLTDDGVRGTLQALAQAAAGSRLVFTFVRKDFVDGTNLYDAEPIYRDYKLKHDVLHFGLEPGQVSRLLGEYGWTESEQVGTAELTAAYVAPTGRDVPVSQIERCVYAEKT